MAQLPMPSGLQLLDFFTSNDGTKTMLKAMYNGEMLPILEVSYANAIEFSEKLETVMEDMRERANEHCIEEVYSEVESDEVTLELDPDFEKELNEDEEEEEE